MRHARAAAVRRLDPVRRRTRRHRAPRPGKRKMVLATSIAETSLTIEGIRVVVDSGLRRYAEFDPVTGMSRLVTGKVSQAAADQRRGRAGRLSSGDLLRLWSEGTPVRACAAHTAPEILHADLAPLALELGVWGAPMPPSLQWLDPPPAAPLAQARDLLRRLEAIDAAERITRSRARSSPGSARIRASRTCCVTQRHEWAQPVLAAISRPS